MIPADLTQPLAEIAKADDAVRKLEAERAKLDERLADARQAVQTLKRGLVAKLRDYLSDLEGDAAAKDRAVLPHGGDATGGRRRLRVGSVSSAVIDVLADGQPRLLPVIAAELVKTGHSVKCLGVTLSLLARQGRIQRIARGTYRAAASAGGA